MDNNDASSEGFDPMDEIRKAEIQEYMLADAFNNSYKLLIKQ